MRFCPRKLEKTFGGKIINKADINHLTLFNKMEGVNIKTYLPL